MEHTMKSGKERHVAYNISKETTFIWPLDSKQVMQEKGKGFGIRLNFVKAIKV